MQKVYEVRGVPGSIARDAWWLEGTEGAGVAAPAARGGGQGRSLLARGGPAAVLALVLLGDVLFWGHAAGLSVAIFALGIVLVAGSGRPLPVLGRAVAVCLVGAAPVFEYLQPLSFLFLSVGLMASLAVLHGPGDGLPVLAARAAGLFTGLPRQWLRCLNPRRLLRRGGGAAWPTDLVRLSGALRDWAFPLGGSLVFLALLMDANPVFLRIGLPQLDPLILQRMLFWGGLAVLVTPFLQAELPAARLPQVTVPRLPGLGLNARSVLRALVMFNLLIGVQMASDLTILAGGAALPRGMTYAEYAHRGAYPLLVTAMLAGAFAVAARPVWREHRLIRPLMALWLVQNVAVTGAAALRLDLYIGAYGLTYLRLYALIWMGLVAAGLALALWQMLRGHGTGWLLCRAAGMGAATLYACAFVNFAGIVAAQNLTRPMPDIDYVCSLGPMAAGEFARAHMIDRLVSPSDCNAAWPPRIKGWRDWGYRAQRVDRMFDVSMLRERAE